MVCIEIKKESRFGYEDLLFSLDLTHWKVEHAPENSKVTLNVIYNFVKLPIVINIFDW
jgi:hypothetical protein